MENASESPENFYRTYCNCRKIENYTPEILNLLQTNEPKDKSVIFLVATTKEDVHLRRCDSNSTMVTCEDLRYSERGFSGWPLRGSAN